MSTSTNDNATLVVDAVISSTAIPDNHSSHGDKSKQNRNIIHKATNRINHAKNEYTYFKGEMVIMNSDVFQLHLKQKTNS